MFAELVAVVEATEVLVGAVVVCAGTLVGVGVVETAVAVADVVAEIEVLWVVGSWVLEGCAVEDRMAGVVVVNWAVVTRPGVVRAWVLEGCGEEVCVGGCVVVAWVVETSTGSRAVWVVDVSTGSLGLGVWVLDGNVVGDWVVEATVDETCVVGAPVVGPCVGASVVVLLGSACFWYVLTQCTVGAFSSQVAVSLHQCWSS
mmetsp:Transcript_118236/g.346374  ORF Transcript_118236/g.346374 Transcript_118236/m.346374 type:complete len:201 (-) Transcript_118236:1341-1943(-)